MFFVSYGQSESQTANPDVIFIYQIANPFFDYQSGLLRPLFMPFDGV